MAVSQGLTMEVRIAGSDTNGGGYLPGAAGADFSQQNSPNSGNQGTTTLNGTITSGATSLIATSASSLYGVAQALLTHPLVGDWIKIDSEIIKVTAVTTNTLTITRAQLGTSAAAHITGATITNISNVSTTDVATAGTLVLTSATAYWSANAVGNVVYIAGGSASLTGAWGQITAVSTSGSNTTATVASASANFATGTGATMNLGGALASPSIAVNVANQAGCTVYILNTGTAFSITSVSAGVTGGIVGVSAASYVVGYQTNRSIYNSDPSPTITANVTSATLITGGAMFINIILNGNSQATTKLTSTYTFFLQCTIENFTTANTGTPSYVGCLLTGNSVIHAGSMACYCEAYGNTATPLNCSFLFKVLSYSNTGATTDGVEFSGIIGSCPAACIGVTAVNNGRHGVNLGNTLPKLLLNSYAQGNGTSGTGFGFINAGFMCILLNCGGFNNTSGLTSGFVYPNGYVANSVSVTGDAFTNTAGNVYTLNSLPGQGAALRAAALPALFPRGLTAAYEDAGAVQHHDSPAIFVEVMNSLVTDTVGISSY